MQKLLLPVVCLAFAPLSSAVRAQDRTPFLNWEHSLTTRTSKSKYPIAQLKIYNNWTPARHRLLVKYNVLGLGAQNNWISKSYGPAFAMPDFNPARILSKASYHHGTLGIVERLDDDRLVIYSSEDGQYYVEPRLALMKRLRFDPWKKIAPELSKEDPPSFTPEQRARLGREMRAAVRPLIKKVFKSYFRPLPETRTFNVAGEAIAARGYRMTMLFNAGGEGEGAQWYRMSAEWWLAPGTPGDEVLTSYGARYLADLKQWGGPTASMWMNEALPVLWEMMPQAMHQAVETFMPQGVPFGFDGDRPFQMSGAPVYVALTLTPPAEPEYASGIPGAALKGLSALNVVRVEVQLNRRDTRALGAQLFEAPPEYKKGSMEPTLKEWDEGMEAVQSLFDDDMRLSDASPARTAQPRYSWSAMRHVLRALNEAR